MCNLQTIQETRKWLKNSLGLVLNFLWTQEQLLCMQGQHSKTDEKI